ncbi:MAG: PH domain-containing protein, partial [Bacteroidota bacterium]
IAAKINFYSILAVSHKCFYMSYVSFIWNLRAKKFTMSFENHQINSKQLPKVETVQYLKVDKNSLAVSLIGSVLWWGFILLTTSFFIYLNNFDYPSFMNYVVLGLLLALAIFSLTMIVLGYSKKGYALRTQDVSFKEGVLWKSHTVVPFNRIQHSEVTQGPVQSMFELASISIYTAGGSASDLTITGLQEKEAHQIKDFLLQKITRPHDAA